MKMKVVWHYEEEDKEFDSDYSCIDLFDEEGNLVWRFGDAYHDSGHEKLDGFIDGIVWATGEQVELVREQIADGEC